MSVGETGREWPSPDHLISVVVLCWQYWDHCGRGPGSYPHLMGRHTYTQPHFSYIILGKNIFPKNILVAANYVTLALFDGRSGRRCIVGNSGQDDDIVHRRKGSMMRCHRQVLGPVSYLVSEGTMKSSFQMVSKGFPPIDKIVGPHFLQPQTLPSVNICETKTRQVV